MQEPGLDRHAWETELESIRDDLAEAPAQALPGLARLVARMLEERGFTENADPEIVASYEAARETAERVDGDEDVDPGDVAQAIDDLLAVFEHVNAERPAP